MSGDTDGDTEADGTTAAPGDGDGKVIKLLRVCVCVFPCVCVFFCIITQNI